MSQVSLIGEAAAVGALQGELQRAVLQERAARFERVCAAARLSRSTQRERAARFAATLEKAVPHWLAEATALAGAAGLETEQLLCWNAAHPELETQPHRPAPLRNFGECTAFFALHARAAGGKTIFHKNRESADEVQYSFVKQSGGAHRFAGGADIGNLGTAHLLSERGFAGANNTGSPVAPEHVCAGGLDDCHLLRYFGESCASLDEIVPRLQDLIARGLVRGASSGTGAIFLFADAARGLVIETTARRCHHEWIEGDVVAARTNHFVFDAMRPLATGEHPGSAIRYRRARELLAQTPALDEARCAAIARDRENAPHAICRHPSDGLGTATVSASICTLGGSAPSMTLYNGHPAFAEPIMLVPQEGACESDWISGARCQAYRQARGWV